MASASTRFNKKIRLILDPPTFGSDLFEVLLKLAKGSRIHLSTRAVRNLPNEAKGRAAVDREAAVVAVANEQEVTAEGCL